MQVMGQQPSVSVVDDDESVRESLPDPLQQGGFAAQRSRTSDHL
jgi:FixJ family two-component response regulator